MNKFGRGGQDKLAYSLYSFVKLNMPSGIVPVIPGHPLICLKEVRRRRRRRRRMKNKKKKKEEEDEEEEEERFHRKLRI